MDAKETDKLNKPLWLQKRGETECDLKTSILFLNNLVSLIIFLNRPLLLNLFVPLYNSQYSGSFIFLILLHKQYKQYNNDNY